MNAASFRAFFFLLTFATTLPLAEVSAAPPPPANAPFLRSPLSSTLSTNSAVTPFLATPRSTDEPTPTPSPTPTPAPTAAPTPDPVTDHTVVPTTPLHLIDPTRDTYFLIAGFQGAFVSGQERGQIGFSTDYIRFTPVPGFENYIPATYGLLKSRVNYAEGETVTIGTTTYTFRKVLTGAPNEVLIDATEMGSICNLGGAIRLQTTYGQGPGRTYGVNTIANPIVTVALTDTHTLAIASRTNGDMSPTTTTAANASWVAPTLNGGIRDTNLIKTPAGYLVSYGTTSAGGFYKGGGMAISRDLITWTQVSNDSEVGGHWFTDTDGTIYALSASRPSFRKLLPPYDGLSLSPSTPFTFEDGSPVIGRDSSALLHIGPTYHLFWAHRDGAIHHATSSKIASAYTDLGPIEGWPHAEGISVATRINNSKTLYFAYFFSQGEPNRSQQNYSTSPDAMTWSPPQVVGDAQHPFGHWWDNVCGFSFNDEKTLSDIRAALGRSPEETTP